MDVDTSLEGNRQNVARENLAVGGYHQQIGLERLKSGDSFRRIDALGLKNGNVMLQGDGFHAAADLAGAAALLTDGAVRLRDQTDHRMRSLQKRRKCRLGESAGAHHD